MQTIIDMFLEIPGSGNISDEEMWNTPMSSQFFLHDGDGFESLKCFIASAVNSFGDELDLVIDRNKDILEQAARKYKNSAFDITRPLNVSFKGEAGLDAGGLTREYFQLLVDRIRKQTTESIVLFEGQDNHLLPIHNYDLVSGGFFTLVGKMILHSILNKCHGVTGLSPAIVVYLATGSRDAAIEHITLEDVPDPVYQEVLHKVNVLGVSLSGAPLRHSRLKWQLSEKQQLIQADKYRVFYVCLLMCCTCI